MKRNNVLIGIDGSSLLSRSFYGTLPNEYSYSKTDEEKKRILNTKLLKSNGYYTNGVFVFLKTLLKIKRDINPDYLYVAWDKDRNTFRRDLYPEYKGTRKDKPIQLKEQFELMQNILKYLGISQFIHDNYEADDILGSVSNKFKGEIKNILISGDSDILQLLGKNRDVYYLNESKNIIKLIKKEDSGVVEGFTNLYNFKINNFSKIYDFKPTQMVDLKALAGDTADNIPGVEGLGETSALKLLKVYQNIEDLFKDLEKVKTKEDIEELKKILKEKHKVTRIPMSKLLAKEAKKMAFLSKELATIKEDILIKDKLESFYFTFHKKEFLKTLKKLEMKSLYSLIDDFENNPFR